MQTITAGSLLCLLAFTFTLAARPAQATSTSTPDSPQSSTAATGHYAAGNALEAGYLSLVNAHIIGPTWQDKNKEPKAIVLCVPGLGLTADDFEPLGKALAQEGIELRSMWVRGRHPTSNMLTRRLDLKGTVKDVHTHLEYLRSIYPQKPIFLLGESLGGSIALCVAGKNRCLDGLICGAPTWKLKGGSGLVMKSMTLLLLGPARVHEYASKVIITSATSSQALRDHWHTDPAHSVDMTLKETLGFTRFVRKAGHYASKITVPVLLMQGTHDQLTNPLDSAQIFARLPAKDKKLVLDGAAEHLIFEEGQFNGDALKTIADWLTAHLNAEGNNSHTARGVLLGIQGLSTQEREEAAKIFKKAKLSNFEERESSQ